MAKPCPDGPGVVFEFAINMQTARVLDTASARRPSVHGNRLGYESYGDMEDAIHSHHPDYSVRHLAAVERVFAALGSHSM
jgi:hypothetical protein